MPEILVFQTTDSSAIAPSLLTRKIVHIDMDAFFATIEELDNPKLKAKPLIVGGQPDSRGVVATANYEARKYGIKSAMPVARAIKLYPKVIIVKPRFQRYIAISKKLSSILKEFSATIEKPSLDEAYLDVTEKCFNTTATKIAQQIKRSIKNNLGLSCSAGIAPNKLLAKIASDINKPDGLTVILPKAVKSFMRQMPLNKIPGVGPVTAKKLATANATVCSDLWELSPVSLQKILGKYGASLHLQAQGIDERPVVSTRIRKSYGLERTFAKNLTDESQKQQALKRLQEQLAAMIERYTIKARTLTLKLRYSNFKTVTRSVSQPTTIEQENLSSLIQHLWQRNIQQHPIRLLGLSLSNLDLPAISKENSRELTLF